MNREVILVYSRAELPRDEQVHRQIRLCAEQHDLKSVGLGSYGGPVIRHFEIRSLASAPPKETGPSTDFARSSGELPSRQQGVRRQGMATDSGGAQQEAFFHRSPCLTHSKLGNLRLCPFCHVIRDKMATPI